MASRLQLAEQVIRILKGYKPTDDRNIDIREVALAIDQRRDMAIRQFAFESINSGDNGWVLGDYVTAYTENAVYDDARKMHRLVLKYDVFTLPHDKGVWFIGANDGEERAYTPIRNGYSSLLGGSLSMRVLLGESPVYFVEGKNVFIKGIKGCEKCNLLVKQVAVSGSLEDDDYYAMPSGMGFMVIADVLKIYGVQIPPDEINNDLDGR